MAKDKKLAIKRIGIADVSQKSIATLFSSSAIVFGEERIGFEVKEWNENAKKGDKQKILWHFRSVEKLFHRNVLDGDEIFWIDGIPNELCGDVEYQIVASKEGVEGEAVFTIKGATSPLVTKSWWSVETNGSTYDIKNRQKTTPVPVGARVTLELNTEGLNGKDLVIKFYAIRSFFENMSFEGLKNPTANDIHLPDCDISVKCIDGKVNKLIDTRKLIKSHFTLDKDIESIYVTVICDGHKIKDGEPYNDTIHAVGLCIDTKKSIGSKKNIYEPTNTTITRISGNKINPIKYSSCTFKELTLVIPSYDLHERLFLDGTTHKSQINNKHHYIKESNIYFDIDRDIPDATNLAKLKQLAAYLVETKNELELTGYADNTGSNKHNDDLAARRVANVRQILLENGVDKKDIQIGSYGKYRSTGESKEDRAIDRKVSIRYDIYMSKQQKTIVYQIVAPNSTYPLPIEINFRDFKVEGCQKPDNHKHKAEVSIKTPTKTESLSCGESGVINLNVHSGKYDLDYSNFLAILYGNSAVAILANTSISDSINTYEIGLHTCDYYPNPKVPTLAFLIYPDVNLIYNFRYDFEEQYPFKGLNFGLVKGVSMFEDWKETFDKFMAPIYLITDRIGVGENGEAIDLKYLMDAAWTELIDRADLFQTGVHAAYNFIEGTPLDTHSFSQKHYITTQITHIYYTACQIIVELLIQYLLKGKGKFKGKAMAEKAAKEKPKDLWNKMKASPQDYITTPKIAEACGIYYTQKQEGVSRMYEMNICARPLLGVKFDKTINLLEDEDNAEGVLKDGKLIEWFKENKKYKNSIQKAEFTIGVSANIGFDYNLTVDSLAKNVTGSGFKNPIDYKLDNNLAFNVKPGVGIDFTLEFDIKGNINKTISLLDIARATVDVDLETKGKDIKASFIYRRSYIFATQDTPSYCHEFEFTGINGKLFQKAKGSVEGSESWGIDTSFDTNKDNKEVEFSWAPGVVFRSKPIPFTFF